MLYVGYAILALLVWIAVAVVVGTLVGRGIHTDPPEEIER